MTVLTATAPIQAYAPPASAPSTRPAEPQDQVIVDDLNRLLQNPTPDEGELAFEPYQRACWGPFCRRKYMTPDEGAQKLATGEEVQMDKQNWTHWEWEQVCHWVPGPPPGGGREECHWERRWQPWPHLESTGDTFTLNSSESLREFYVAQDVHGLVERYGLGDRP